NTPHAQVVRRQLQSCQVADLQAGKTFFIATVHKRRETVAIRQFGDKRAIWQRFHYAGFDAEGIFTHVKISGSPLVIRTVCSKWADSEPSIVTTVQPSFNIFISGQPAFTIGSMAIVMPGFSLGEFRLSSSGSSKFGTCGSSCIVRPTPCPTNSRTTL